MRQGLAMGGHVTTNITGEGKVI